MLHKITKLDIVDIVENEDGSATVNLDIEFKDNEEPNEDELKEIEKFVLDAIFNAVKEDKLTEEVIENEQEI